MKKTSVFLLSWLLLLMMTGCSENTTNNGSQQEEKTETVAAEKHEFNRIKTELSKGVDGDTIEVFYKGRPEKVRFLLVDSPETSHPRLGKQPYGQEAKDFTTKIVEEAKNLEIEFDIGQKQDKYGRLLAYVYADGKSVQEELLKRGFARVAYVYPPNTRYVDEFNLIQKQAQQEEAGIWEVENYSREDGFHPEVMGESKTSSVLETEKLSKNKKTANCNIKGNISSSGKIYHTPDSPWYQQTKAEVMFCSEEEAIKAGFRAPQR
ncbi:nuclease [Mesobacillus zeae]|uniref:Nuclease n=2 Tax=Mesobacillus zeae TaxID=1917180 RepID=A0A398B7Y0_9BACI|nr:nuclease [Mesobacillus zeae]